MNARRLSALLIVAVFGLAPSPADAQSCSADLTCQFLVCRSPASGVPSTLWGELKPVDEGRLPTFRDNTDFDEFKNFNNENEPHWASVDIEEGWIFAAITQGLQIWDATANPAAPVRVDVLGRADFPNWVSDPHETDPVRDVDAPPGNSDVVAVAQVGDGGVAIFDARNKSSLVARYGDAGKAAAQVYAGTVGGRDYAVAATKGQGVLVYDMTSAFNRTSTCLETTPGQQGCGVYEGRIGSRASTSFVDGVSDAAGSKLWVAFSAGNSGFGVEIWDLSNPASPQQRISSLSNEFVHGVALWRSGSKYYLGTRVLVTGGTQLRIYDVSCLATNSCNNSLGNSLKTVSLPGGGNEFYVTWSQGNGRDFLYLGSVDRCNPSLQNEWLYDVTTPSSATDITPPAKMLNGVLTGYWGWYYRRNPTGFNFVNPRVGKFVGPYFYRAAYTIFDIHELTTGGPPTANFTWSPSTVYRGQNVSFTDTSTGVPTSWSWTFPNASPASSTSQNPTGVVFNTTGNKLVTLGATNANGTDSESKTIAVLAPEPQIGSVSASPNPAFACQQVSFTAQNVTGLPPLTYSWQVKNSAGTVVDTGGNVNPFAWDTTGLVPAEGPYTATVTVTNAAMASTSANSAGVTLNALTPLAFTSPGGAPETLNGPPFSGPSVNFRIQTPGATEWRWNFGDGTPLSWTSDPTAGPQPTHTYAANDTYTVTVEIRNCQEGALQSNATLVTIDNSTPLVADFAAQCAFVFGGDCFADPGDPIPFTDSSQGSPDFWDYDWDGDGVFEDAGNLSPLTSHTYDTAGTFLPQLKVRRGSGQATKVHGLIFVIGDGGQPAVAVIGPSSGETSQQLSFSAFAANCFPQPTSWNWVVGDGGSIIGSQNGPAISVSYSTAGTKNVQASAANGGCSGSSGNRQTMITANPNSIFTDGFESGNLSAWAVVIGPN